MRNSDIDPIVKLTDVPAATGLLTRLPVRVDGAAATARGAAAAWAYPVVGLIVGFIAAFAMFMAGIIGLPAGAIAFFGIATLTIVTGAMHEDGLADTADGLWGGWDVARRLEIMKDSHIGAYGVIAIVLSLLLRWVLLTELVGHGAFAAVIAAAMLSRATMVGVMAWLPNARNTGLSQAVGRPSWSTVMIAAAIAVAGGLGLVGFAAIWVTGVVVLISLGCGLIARAKIGGQTGDILGAVQQITEISVLLCLTALIAG